MRFIVMSAVVILAFSQQTIAGDRLLSHEVQLRTNVYHFWKKLNAVRNEFYAARDQAVSNGRQSFSVQSGDYVFEGEVTIPETWKIKGISPVIRKMVSAFCNGYQALQCSPFQLDHRLKVFLWFDTLVNDHLKVQNPESVTHLNDLMGHIRKISGPLAKSSPEMAAALELSLSGEWYAKAYLNHRMQFDAAMNKAKKEGKKSFDVQVGRSRFQGRVNDPETWKTIGIKDTIADQVDYFDDRIVQILTEGDFSEEGSCSRMARHY